MTLRIKKVGQRRGMMRYSVGFAKGMPCEFLIQTPPKGIFRYPGCDRDYQAAFIRGVIQACGQILKYLEPPLDRNTRQHSCCG